jgi:hypothetical protein
MFSKLSRHMVSVYCGYWAINTVWSCNQIPSLTYRISWDFYTPYAGDSGMSLHDNGKLKSSRLSYNWVVSFPTASMLNKTSKYEAEVEDCVVTLISCAFGYTESTYEWNWYLLIDKTSSIYLNVELKVTARGLFFSCRGFWMNSASQEY